jgi:hypothetical protein
VELTAVLGDNKVHKTPKGTGYMAVVIPDGPDDTPNRDSMVRQGDRFWSVLATERPHSWQPTPDVHLLLSPWEKSKTEGPPEPGRMILASGCCLDRPYGRGCADDNCMSLPPEETCKGCVHVETCVSIFGQKADAHYCQWFPRRYCEALK